MMMMMMMMMMIKVTPCGPNNHFYSNAGNGMGLVSEAIMVELGKTNIKSTSIDSKKTKKTN